MNKVLKIWVDTLLLAVFTLLPAAFGLLIYSVKFGSIWVAACNPIDWPWFVICITGSYVLLSFATGNIMWVEVFYAHLLERLLKDLRS